MYESFLFLCRLHLSKQPRNVKRSNFQTFALVRIVICSFIPSINRLQ